ncbi:tol-pal system protein YbgF [Vibrio sp. SCSIO 43136]|uniref:tol-pal system protein YbgF n=1 Tax=Vibrio sp. SCSIO 43136 TaxID=2819101 RepID=UPI0020764955|nr:tol-pal system protein YbgF [Vibrio sp. SCSIO 43136]USD64319.1 tol-pal system protein YbgF [Vibrio sp. SCSIO 43136]
MFSNSKRVVTLTLLASAANLAFAAPAPVSDLSESTTVVSTTRTTSPETDVQRLERLLQNRAKLQIQMQNQIDQLNEEVGQLRGEVERNSHEMKKMVDRQRELFLELDNLRQQMQTNQVAPITDTETPATSGTYTANKDEAAAYQDAVDLILQKRDYAGAVVAFKEFQAAYPDSKFMPNAHYWLGQLYFAQQEDEQAVKSFAAVVAYKDSNKRADALLKLGDIALRAKNPDAAKKYFQQVIEEYPNASAAKLAKERL